MSSISAAMEAAWRTRGVSPGPLGVIAFDDNVHGHGCIPCGPVNVLGEPASLTCVFDAQAASARCLARVLTHQHVTLDEVTLALDGAGGQLLAVDLLWDLLRRDEQLEQAATAAEAAGLPRSIVERLAHRRRTQIAERKASAAARGELTRTRRRAEHTAAREAARAAIAAAVRDADGDPDALLHAAAQAIDATVLLEDPTFHVTREASPGVRNDAPPTPGLADVLTPGRLARLAGELRPGIVAAVPPGTPAAGTRLVLRLGARAYGTYGYVSAVEVPSARTETATQWLEHLEASLVASLRCARDRSDLAADLRTHIVRLLASGTLDATDAAAAAEHTGWHRGGSARMAAILPTDRGTDLEPLDATCRRVHAAGFSAAVHDGYVAVLLTSAKHDLEGLTSVPGAPSFVVGVGATCTDATATARSFREAAWAARLAVVSAKRVLHFDDLGVHRLLMPGAEFGDPALEAPVELLERAATELGFDPIETLTVYLDAGGSPVEAARRLHVHVNSIRYRLDRIARIAALDLADPEVRFRVQLALRIRASRQLLRSGA